MTRAIQQAMHFGEAARRVSKTALAERTSAESYSRLSALSHLVPALIREPSEFRHVPAWIRAWKSGSSLKAEVPWLPFQVVGVLRTYLSPEAHVFEFGSGGSTLWFGRHTGTITSVEHDLNWYRRVSQAIRNADLTNCKLILEPPRQEQIRQVPFAPDCVDYSSVLPGSFEQYVKSIDRYPDESFDLVVVDGRSRPACVVHAMQKIKRGGLLILDDSLRTRYIPALEVLNGWPRRDFMGIRPMGGLNQTSVWTRLEGRTES